MEHRILGPGHSELGHYVFVFLHEPAPLITKVTGRIRESVNIDMLCTSIHVSAHMHVEFTHLPHPTSCMCVLGLAVSWSNWLSAITTHKSLC